MKYSVLGFNQAKIVETDLDLTDLLILNYIMQACGSPKMKHILDGTDYPLVWIQHSKISEDLPILRLSEGTLRNRLTKLKQCGYISSKMTANDNMRGTRTYYGLTELTMSFIYDVENTTTSLKNDMEDRACHSKMTPDNLLINNNILNNTISKDIVGETPTETSSLSNSELSEYEQHMYEEDVRNKRKIVTEKKPKKSLWQKCSEAIDEYTQDEQLKKALYDYLSMRLQMKDKPMYANQWKAMLNKLSTLEDDPLKVVQQSIERAYGGFFPVSKNYGWQRNNKPDPSTFGEHKGMSSKKVSKEEREEILKHGTVY